MLVWDYERIVEYISRTMRAVVQLVSLIYSWYDHVGEDLLITQFILSNSCRFMLDAAAPPKTFIGL